MNDLWNRIIENPVAIICVTILGCALVFGGVCCVKAEYEYKLKRQELQNQGSKEFFNR